MSNKTLTWDYRPGLECDFCGTLTWTERRRSGQRQCRACKIVYFFSNVLFAPLGHILPDWSEKILRSLYGTIDQETGLRQYRTAFISLGKQNGKQLSLDTPMLTPSGWRFMDDLSVGDEVFDDSGRPTPIVAVSDVDETERAFEITFAYGCKLVAGARHGWVAQKCGMHPQIYQTEALFNSFLRCDERPSVRIRLPEPIEYPTADLPIDPYVYGFWLGNGCATKPELTINRRDVPTVLSHIPYKISSKYPNGEGFSDIVRVPALKPILVESYLHKRIPPVYQRASIQQRWELVAGLMDSDGCISTNKGQASYGTILPDLAEDVRELLRSLSIKSNILYITSDRYGVPNQPFYKVAFTANSDMPVSKLERKLIRRHPRHEESKSHYEHIWDIQEVPKRLMKCIQVAAQSHLYLAGRDLIPTHNSMLIGGLPIYHLMMEDEINPEVVGAAAAKDQAEIVFKATSSMINANPSLLTKLRIIPSTKRILEREGPGIYKVVSADGDVQDGQRPSLLIRDEIHRWKTLRHETVRDVLTKGQISRVQPLDIQITTSGAEYESQLWWTEYQFAKQVLLDQSIAPQYYAAIWQADPEKMERDPEYWKSREARVAANPSHEDLGGHLRDAALVNELQKALRDPSERSKYLRYHLNLPLRSTEDPVIDMVAWYKCGDPVQLEADRADKTQLAVDLRNWPVMDLDLLIKKWNLVEQPCYGGIDASWTTDFTSLVLLFRPSEENEIWTFLPFFWIPKDRIPELERTTRMPLASWAERGFLTATPGDTINMAAVKDRIKWADDMFDLIEVDYDRNNFRTEATALLSEGVQTVEVKQNFMELSFATKYVLTGTLDKAFRHGNHPVLNWMANCLQLQYDRKDNVQPSKPERMKSARRIDGMSAIVTGLARALVAPKPRKSVYASRGLRTI